jgi:hypothetical protein
MSIALITSSLLGVTPKVFAQSSSCNDLPGIELKQTLNASGVYAVWVLAKKETPTAVPYIKLDNNACQQLALPKGADWEWVKGSSGTIKQSLSSGDHTFKVSVDGGAVLIDKILVSTDTNCDPSGNGQNCIEEPIDFAVEGIEQGSTVTGERKISASLSVETNDSVQMEFFIDNKSIAKQLTAPYCLIETSKGGCGVYNVSTLGEGKHTLRVSASTPGGQYVTKKVDFTVGSKNSLPTTVGSSSNVVESGLPDTLSVAISGVSEGESVTGKKVISATAGGSAQPITVSFALNGTDISSSASAPYCFVEGSTCGEWDSEMVTNGDYVLIAVASAPGVRSKEAKVTFKVNNASITSATSADKKQIIIGNTNQQVSGKSVITLSASKLKELQNVKSITYLIDGKEVGTASPARPEVDIDTESLTNGKHMFSAVLNAFNGESAELTSEVVVRNDVAQSVAVWLRKNAAVASAVAVGVAAVLYIIVRFVVGRIRYRRMMKMHNISETYVVNPGSRHGLRWNVSYALSSLIVVFGVGLVLFRIGVTHAGIGIGFVNEMENGIPTAGFSGLSLGYENNMTIAFARLAYTRPTPSAPDAPKEPSPATNGDGMAVNTASTGFEGESMALESGLGMAVTDTSSHGGMSMLIWTEGSAYKTVNSIGFKSLTVRARRPLCSTQFRDQTAHDRDDRRHRIRLFHHLAMVHPRRDSRDHRKDLRRRVILLHLLDHHRGLSE